MTDGPIIVEKPTTLDEAKADRPIIVEKPITFSGAMANRPIIVEKPITFSGAKADRPIVVEKTNTIRFPRCRIKDYQHGSLVRVNLFVNRDRILPYSSLLEMVIL